MLPEHALPQKILFLTKLRQFAALGVTRRQKPFGIDAAEYHRHFIERLRDFYNEALRKSLIESISSVLDSTSILPARAVAGVRESISSRRPFRRTNRPAVW